MLTVPLLLLAFEPATTFQVFRNFFKMDGFKMCLYFSALMAVANADATDSISSKFNLNINEIFIQLYWCGIFPNEIICRIFKDYQFLVDLMLKSVSAHFKFWYKHGRTVALSSAEALQYTPNGYLLQLIVQEMKIAVLILLPHESLFLLERLD